MVGEQVHFWGKNDFNPLKDSATTYKQKTKLHKKGLHQKEYRPRIKSSSTLT
jgi:hypothetical protein